MLNENKLKEKIQDSGLSIDNFTKKIGINKSTFYRKIARNSFLLREMDIMFQILSLTNEDAIEIFFTA